jgi:hypothetical protein
LAFSGHFTGFPETEPASKIGKKPELFFIPARFVSSALVCFVGFKSTAPALVNLIFGACPFALALIGQPKRNGPEMAIFQHVSGPTGLNHKNRIAML